MKILSKIKGVVIITWNEIVLRYWAFRIFARMLKYIYSHEENKIALTAEMINYVRGYKNE
jgi:hypothetical protein